jgi:hypothetical protein
VFNVVAGEGDDSWWLYRNDAGQVFILQENSATEINRWEIGAFLDPNTKP